MTANLVELGLFKKGIITKKLDITCLDTLYQLIEAKLVGLAGFNDDNPVNETWTRLALEYRTGQIRIYNHYLDLVQKNCLQVISDTNFIRFDYEEGDEFGGTVSGLITKLHEGDEKVKALYEKYDANRCKKILGKEYSEFKEFYEDFGGDKRQVLWGFTMVKVFGGEFASCCAGSESGFGLFLSI